MQRVSYRVFGILALVLGAIGALVPILPTTPFVLLAAFFFSRSSPRLHRWLRQNRWFGGGLRDWEDHRVIRMPAKFIATITLVAVAVLNIVWWDLRWYQHLAIDTVFLGVLTFIWLCPASPNRSHAAQALESRS